MVAAEGVTESAGVAFWLRITTVTPPEVPPPGAGVVTCTLNWPGLAISEACTWQVSEELLTNVVVRGLPLIETVDALVKPLGHRPCIDSRGGIHAILCSARDVHFAGGVDD